MCESVVLCLPVFAVVDTRAYLCAGAVAGGFIDNIASRIAATAGPRSQAKTCNCV